MDSLKARAMLLQQVRAFFISREVLEVETPLLSSGIGTDPHLSPLELVYQKRPLFLQTSPEFAMKRLLVEGSGSIFQICKAFREGEASSKHNPEFTMLEWYRLGFDEYQLMDEVAELVQVVLGIETIKRLSYRQLFQQYLDIDPHHASASELAKIAKENLDLSFESNDRDLWLDLLYSHLIEPQLVEAVFIYHYPKSQAALAQLITDDEGVEVARRFELVIKGLELANGYFELTDAGEQRQRFESEQALRQAKGLPQYPLDQNFLTALEKGLPTCAGVAIGFDRLLMLQTDSNSIGAVLPFTMDRV